MKLLRLLLVVAVPFLSHISHASEASYELKHISIVDWHNVKRQYLRKSYAFAAISAPLPIDVQMKGDLRALTRLVCDEVLIESHPPSVYEDTLVDLPRYLVPLKMEKNENNQLRRTTNVHPIFKAVATQLDSRYHDPHTFAALLLLSSHHENHTVKFDDGHGESDYDIPRSINRHIIQLSEDDSMISVKDLKSCELRMLSPSEVNEESGGYLSRSSPGMEEEIYATSFPLRAMDAVPPPSESLKSDLVASTSSALMQWIQAYKVDADRKDIYSDGEDCINLNKGGGNSSLLQVSVSSHVKVQGLMKTMMEVLDAIMEPIESLVAATLGGSIIGAMSVKVIQSADNEIGAYLTSKLSAGLSSNLKDSLIPVLSRTITESITDTLGVSLRNIMEPKLKDDMTRTLTKSLSAHVASRIPQSLGEKVSKKLRRNVGRELSVILTKSLSSSITASLVNVLSHNPLQDYYCYYCSKHNVYCGYCVSSPAQLYYANYYASYYGQYYSYYYSDYFAAAPTSSVEKEF